MIEVFGKPGCQPCKFTVKLLTDAGVTFTYRDVTEDPAAADAVRSMGYQGVPVVRTAEDQWHGLQPDKIRAAIVRLSPVLA